MKHKRLIVVALGAGVVAALALRRRSKAGRSVADSVGPAFAESPLQVVEVETTGVDDDGNAVIDDLVVAVDDEGHIVASDETVAVISPRGDVVVDETLSVVGEDGRLHAVEEDIAVLDADDE